MRFKLRYFEIKKAFRDNKSETIITTIIIGLLLAFIAITFKSHHGC